jgi:hypothetical protein
MVNGVPNVMTCHFENVIPGCPAGIRTLENGTSKYPLKIPVITAVNSSIPILGPPFPVDLIKDRTIDRTASAAAHNPK